ncbi:class I SAM-dependent methyltransferase [candidate division WOR-3 bacterium]|nr:class I SAM-dependent methyltransferase [candidate division WOR-3 bacterium]
MNSKKEVRDTRKYEQMIHDAEASDYDRAIVSQYGMKHKYFTTAVWAKKFQEPFLEYGCGTGVASVVLAEMNREVVAFDISTKMAAITKNKVPSAQVVVADALNLPFKDRSFPTICITGVLHHILDLDGAFDEICRCAKDVICINEPSTSPPPYNHKSDQIFYSYNYPVNKTDVLWHKEEKAISISNRVSWQYL